MKTLIIALTCLLLNGYAYSQDMKEQDVKAIKSLCGCYEIDFNYTETFSPDTNYSFHDDYKTHAAAEVAFVIEETENIISIQHLLVVGEGMIINYFSNKKHIFYHSSSESTSSKLNGLNFRPCPP